MADPRHQNRFSNRARKLRKQRPDFVVPPLAAANQQTSSATQAAKAKMSSIAAFLQGSMNRTKRMQNKKGDESDSDDGGLNNVKVTDF